MPDSTIDLLLARRSVLAMNLSASPARTSRSWHDHPGRPVFGFRIMGEPSPGGFRYWADLPSRRWESSAQELYEREHPDATAAQIAMESERPQRSPLLLIVSFHLNTVKVAKVPEMEQLLSCGAVCQNILIAAQALGYRAQWLTDWPAYHAEVRKFLGHDEDTPIVGFIHVGTAVSPPKERPRPDFDAIVSEWKPPAP